jgi:hypothetical protein
MRRSRSQLGDVVRQSLDLPVGERLCHRRHNAVEIGAGLRFEAVMAVHLAPMPLMGEG